MLQVKASSEQTVLTGRDVHYTILMGGIGLLQLGLGMFYTPLLIVSAGIIVLLVLFYITSKFRITLRADSIVIEKSVYGLTILKFTFAFEEVNIINGDIQFARDSSLLKFIFERETFDTVEFCVDSKYKTIGSVKNSVPLMSALKEAVDKIKKEQSSSAK